MKKLLILLFPLVLLTACKDDGVLVARKFPNVPAELLQACPDLKTVDPNTTKLSDVVEVVSDNYATYYECKNQVDDWIEWYNTQKKIFESVK